MGLLRCGHARVKGDARSSPRAASLPLAPPPMFIFFLTLPIAAWHMRLGYRLRWHPQLYHNQP